MVEEGKVMLSHQGEAEVRVGEEGGQARQRIILSRFDS